MSPGRIGPGAFVAVVGPSGAGKDTMIGEARRMLMGDPRVLFVRRIVTREADSRVEDHEALSEEAFLRAHEHGAFAVTWGAHGLLYGLPASLDDHIRGGGAAIANVSRGAAAGLRVRYARAIVVAVDAPVALRAERLARRGREGAASVLRRLERVVDDWVPSSADRVILNDAAPDMAGAALVATIRMSLDHRAPGNAEQIGAAG